MIYKLYASIGIDTEAAASLDIQLSGNIRAVAGVFCPTGVDALSDIVKSELSFTSSSSFTNNDVKGSIAMACMSQNMLTSGGGLGFTNYSISGLNIPVSQGERIYIHGTITSGNALAMTWYLYIDDDASLPRPPRGRR